MSTFVRVVESGSLSGAARAIPSSLTSVSRQIAALEAQYGTQLLLRTTRRLSLTDDGQLLYDRAKSILGEIGDIERSLSSRQSQPSGRLRISAPILMGRLLIAPLLADFLRRHAALSVDLVLVDRAVDMVEEDIHVALRVGRLPDSQSVARKLADLEMIVCASPDYLQRRGIPQTPDDLIKHDCLVFSDTPGAGEWRFKARRIARSSFPGDSGSTALMPWSWRRRTVRVLSGCHPGRLRRRSRLAACNGSSQLRSRPRRRSICCFRRRG